MVCATATVTAPLRAAVGRRTIRRSLPTIVLDRSPPRHRVRCGSATRSRSSAPRHDHHDRRGTTSFSRGRSWAASWSLTLSRDLRNGSAPTRSAQPSCGGPLALFDSIISDNSAFNGGGICGRVDDPTASSPAAPQPPRERSTATTDGLDSTVSGNHSGFTAAGRTRSASSPRAQHDRRQQRVRRQAGSSSGASPASRNCTVATTRPGGRRRPPTRRCTRRQGLSAVGDHESATRPSRRTVPTPTATGAGRRRRLEPQRRSASPSRRRRNVDAGGSPVWSVDPWVTISSRTRPATLGAVTAISSATHPIPVRSPTTAVTATRRWRQARNRRPPDDQRHGRRRLRRDVSAALRPQPSAATSRVRSAATSAHCSAGATSRRGSQLTKHGTLITFPDGAARCRHGPPRTGAGACQLLRRGRCPCADENMVPAACRRSRAGAPLRPQVQEPARTPAGQR